MQLGNLQQKLGLCKDASDTFKLSLSKFPTVNKDKLKDLVIHSGECAKNINQAKKLMVKRNYGEAIKLLDSVLEVATAATDLRIELARMLLETHQWERLLQVCGVILRTRADDPEVLYMRGWGYLMNGDKETAQIHFRKCLRGDPEHKQCKNGSKFIRKMNKYLNRMEDPEEKDISNKIEAAKDLLEIDGLPTVFENKAQNSLCSWYTENKQYKEAKTACDFVIHHKQNLDESIDVADAYCNIASGYLAEDKYEEAKRIVQEGMKGNEQNRKVSDNNERMNYS